MILTFRNSFKLRSLMLKLHHTKLVTNLHSILFVCYFIYNIQVEILFHLVELNHPSHRTLDLSDLDLIDPQRLKRVSHMTRLMEIKAVKNKEERGIGTTVITCFILVINFIYSTCRFSKACIVLLWVHLRALREQLPYIRLTW